jgi:photosystem II stability/assembly factor-like uncharacterized protein
MVDGTHGYALAGTDWDRYRLLRTVDGGRRWMQATTIRAVALPTVAGRFVFFPTKLRAGVFAVERSDDGGRTWARSRPVRDPKGEIGQIDVVDARHVFLAFGEGAAAGSSAQALYTSGDGGRTWRFVSRTDVTGRKPNALPFGCDKDGFGFATPSRGFAGGYCAGGLPFLYRTDDGGRIWRRVSLPAPRACACDTSAPRFFDARDGVLAIVGWVNDGSGGPFARVYWTHDGGDHWRGSRAPVGRAAPVAVADLRSAWLLGGAPGDTRHPGTRLVRTADAGRTWRTERLPFDGSAYALDAVDADTAFALGPRFLLRTDDGGRSWRSVGPVPLWLTALAARQAQRLHDPTPSLVTYTLGRQDVIGMRGSFACGDCSHGPATQTVRGTIARFVVDPRTHVIDGFSLRMIR